MKNWKTTAAGIGAVLTALVAVINMLASGNWDPQQLGTVIIGALTGLGLIGAKDG